MKSLDQIWSDYHSGLLSFIRRRVGAADLAEDILQDAVMKAHSRLQTLVDEDRIQSWLYQIARNTIIDYHRARKSAEPLPDEVAQWPEHSDEEWQELGKRVLPMIEILPEGYREALLLSDCEATEDGVDTVKVLLANGAERLDAIHQRTRCRRLD